MTRIYAHFPRGFNRKSRDPGLVEAVPHGAQGVAGMNGGKRSAFRGDVQEVPGLRCAVRPEDSLGEQCGALLLHGLEPVEVVFREVVIPDQANDLVHVGISYLGI